MVLTTPLIAYLAERGPVDVRRARRRRRRCSRTIRRCASVIVYDKRGRDRGVARIRSARAAAASRLVMHVAYLAQGSVRSAALALAAGIRERVGFATSAGRRLYTTRVRLHRERPSRRAAASLGRGDPRATHRATCGRASIPAPTERAAVDALLGRHGLERRATRSRSRRAASGRRSAGRTTRSSRTIARRTHRDRRIGAPIDELALEIVARGRCASDRRHGQAVAARVGRADRARGACS